MLEPGMASTIITSMSLWENLAIPFSLSLISAWLKISVPNEGFFQATGQRTSIIKL